MSSILDNLLAFLAAPKAVDLAPRAPIQRPHQNSRKKELALKASPLTTRSQKISFR